MTYTKIESISNVGNILLIVIVIYYIVRIIYWVIKIIQDRNGRKRLVKEKKERSELRSKNKLLRIKKEDWEKEKERIDKDNKEFIDKYGRAK